MKRSLIILLILGLGVFCGIKLFSKERKPQTNILRIGFFPNVTHAQGIIGYYLTQTKQPFFEQYFGKDVVIEWYAFNAGPSAMDALFAGTIDLSYVGPNPAINAYVKSRGRGIKIISGSAVGGAALLTNPRSKISKPSDFKGKIVATPQYGNTQDIACRIWLKSNGLDISPVGGNVSILPTNNPDQLHLFSEGKLDAVWTVEPWVSRLESECQAQVFLEQPEVITTLLVASTKALQEKNFLVKKFLLAHKHLTIQIEAEPQKMQDYVQEGLALCTRRSFPLSLIKSAWARLKFSCDVSYEDLEKIYKDAHSLGMIKEEISLKSILDHP